MVRQHPDGRGSCFLSMSFLHLVVLCALSFVTLSLCTTVVHPLWVAGKTCDQTRATSTNFPEQDMLQSSHLPPSRNDFVPLVCPFFALLFPSVSLPCSAFVFDVACTASCLTTNIREFYLQTLLCARTSHRRIQRQRPHLFDRVALLNTGIDPVHCLFDRVFLSRLRECGVLPLIQFPTNLESWYLTFPPRGR